MFLIVWLFLVSAVSTAAEQGTLASSPQENLFQVSELKEVFPILEKSLKSKVIAVGNSAKCKAHAKCPANIRLLLREIDSKLPMLNAELK
ncbi:MAG: hypothetical protein K2P92_03635 [Bdellovibrionaceae bacterium]|nr:hypothetical protein [Pseudobdellovibrionaceae bacterium]